MKRILFAIAMLVAFIPFVGVKAINETTNYYSYKKGQVVNFYPNSTAEAEHNRKALYTMIIEDKDTSSNFIQVWMMDSASFTVSSTTSLLEFDDVNTNLLNAWYNIHTPAYTPAYETGSETAKEGNYFIDFDNASKGLNIITIKDLKTMVGNEYLVKNNDGSYDLKDKVVKDRNDADTSLYELLQMYYDLAKAKGLTSVMNGFYVVDDTASTKKMLIARYTVENDKIKSIKISAIASTDVDKQYAIYPTAYANKTADCHETVNPMCYVCKTESGTEYKWTADGTGCTAYPKAKTVDECKPKKCYKCVNEKGKYVFKWVLPGDKSVAKCEEVKEITSENDCSELVKTGVESHILEFAIVAALCVIALIVVKRKDLFKTI